MAGLEFHTHTDLVAMVSSNAYFVFVRCGNWTARHETDGKVPVTLPFDVDYTPDERQLDAGAAIAELEAAGLWAPLPGGGWCMKRGGKGDWDDGLPVWRYSTPMDGVELAQGFVLFPEPDAL